MSDYAKFTLSFRHGDASLTLRAQSTVELGGQIQEAEQEPKLAVFFGGAAVPAAEPEPEPTEAEALANLEKHFGAKPVEEASTEELASESLIKVAASKSGKSVEELAGISKAEAQRLIKEGSK